jgi:Cu/Ag efflux protein CusF
LTLGRAILLIDLALLLGLGLGYLWWGREVGRLRAEVATARARPAVSPGEWTATGVVRAVIPDMNLLVLTHDQIGELMPPMTMGFRTASPQLYDGLAVGDEIRFTLQGVPPNVVITAIQKLQ